MALIIPLILAFVATCVAGGIFVYAVRSRRQLVPHATTPRDASHSEMEAVC
jgi:hypothetical protein